jgi:hypothetical protein
VNGADSAFFDTTMYGLAARATGYASNAALWAALRDRPNLAVVDQFAVQRRENWGTQLAKFHLTRLLPRGQDVHARADQLG